MGLVPPQSSYDVLRIAGNVRAIRENPGNQDLGILQLKMPVHDNRHMLILEGKLSING